MMSAGPGNVVVAKDAEGNDQVAANVRNVGAKTFYRKENRWVDAEVKPEDDTKAIVITQFSDDFFKLARAQTAEQNQYLTFGDAVTVRLGSQVYRIDPARN